MTNLSPAAQEVFWAFNSKFAWIEDGVPGPQFKAIAAVLRAVEKELASCHFVDSNENDIKLVIDFDDLYDLIYELEAQ
jgi:hypothetical protein